MTGPHARWLAPGEVPEDLGRPAVWLARDDDPAWRDLAAGLAPSALDLADAALFTSPGRSAARLRRRLLLKALAGRLLGVAAERVVVERAPGGAITVTAPERLCASLAARAGWTMAGLSRAPIGVDVEIADPPAPLPTDMLSPGELAALSALPEPRQPAAFARYWAVKEAALKMAGTGLSADPAMLAVRFDADAATVSGIDGRPFALAEIRPAGPGFAAVAG